MIIVENLIAFTSSEGQTRKIAERIATHAREQGHDAVLYDTGSLVAVPNVEAFDAIIVAASVHEALHQESAIDFALAHREQLRRKPSALISVSLSAAMEDGQAEAQGYADRFMATTLWSPPKLLLLGGALRLSEYDYFQREVLKPLLMKRGFTPELDVNYEFTDWSALDNFVTDFLENA